MRLTCPTCAAQYDVADGIIAPGGQHVQCTACHTRWFERPPARGTVALLGEDEIIARLEARGGRGRRPGRAAEGCAGAPPRQTGGDFRWEGRAATDEARRPGPNLRLVTDVPSVNADTPMPAAEPAGDEAQTNSLIEVEAQPPGERRAGSKAQWLAERPAILATTPPGPEESSADRHPPTAGGRLDLERAAKRVEQPAIAPASERRRGSAALVLGPLILALLAVAYLAAEDLGEAVPVLEAPLDAYIGAIDDVRSAIRVGLGLGSGPNGAAS